MKFGVTILAPNIAPKYDAKIDAKKRQDGRDIRVNIRFASLVDVYSRTGKMIISIMVFNNHGKPRLLKFFKQTVCSEPAPS